MIDTVLTPSQVEAKKCIKRFLFNREDEFILGGGPGMGKTFLVNTLLQEFPKYIEAYEILHGKDCPTRLKALAATTHPAATELYKATGVCANTLHGFLSLIPEKNYQTGETKYVFNPKKEKPNLSNTFLIIDESSMLVTEVYELLISICEPTTKILYVMDVDQLILPDPDCQYPLDFLQHIIDKGNFVELKEQKRIKNPELAYLVEDYRDVVRGTSDFFILENIEGAVKYIESEEELLGFIDKYYFGMAGSNRYLSPSNAAATAFNKLIRNHLNLPDSYITGETVMLNRTLSLNDNKTFLPNSSILEIIKYVGKNSFKVRNGVYLNLHCYQVKTTEGCIHSILAIADYSQYKIILTACKRKKDWANVYFLQENIADLRMYGGISGATVHKGQGASYDNVILDVGDFASIYDRDIAARALYVATSRARNQLFLLGSLPDRFGGSD